MNTLVDVLLISCHWIGAASSNAECQTQKVNAAFVMDGTANVKSEQTNQMVEFIASVIPTIPIDSIWSCAVVNNSSKEIVTSTVSVPSTSSMHYKYLLESFNWNTTGYGGRITSSALDKETNLRFIVTKYKKKTEILYVLISDATEMNNIPAVMLKKKLFLIVFGSTIPKFWKDIASNGDHVHLIRSLEDVQTVADIVIEQTCKDSYFKCDVDQYLKKSSIKCRSCMYVCSTITLSQPESCERNCPYIILPPREEAVRTLDDTARHGPLPEIRDYKPTTLYVVLAVVTGMAFTFALLLVFRRKKLMCFASNNRNEMEMMDIRTVVPDSIAVMETGDADTQNADDPDHPIADQADDTIAPLLDTTPDNTQPVVTELGQRFNIDFSGTKELDMNGEVFGGSDFECVHYNTGKCHYWNCYAGTLSR